MPEARALTGTARRALRPCLSFFFSFRGRTGRFLYALYALFFLAALAGFSVWGVRLDLGLSGNVESYAIVILQGALIWSGAAVLARRLHDFDMSGWWWLLAMAVAVFFPGTTSFLLVLFAFVPGDGDENSYGPPPVTLKALRAAWKLRRLSSAFAAGAIPAADFNAAREKVLPAAAPVYAALSGKA